MQMFIRDVGYSDFYACTFASDNDKKNIHIERIYKNSDFRQECLSKAEIFFRTGLLPELLGNWYTRPTEFISSANDSEITPVISSSEPMYCYCHGPEEDTMICPHISSICITITHVKILFL